MIIFVLPLTVQNENISTNEVDLSISHFHFVYLLIGDLW